MLYNSNEEPEIAELIYDVNAEVASFQARLQAEGFNPNHIEFGECTDSSGGDVGIGATTPAEARAFMLGWKMCQRRGRLDADLYLQGGHPAEDKVGV